MIIDTHIHLDHENYDDDLSAVIEKSRAQNITGFIIPGTDKLSLPKAIALADTHSDIYFAVGLSPLPY